MQEEVDKIKETVTRFSNVVFILSLLKRVLKIRSKEVYLPRALDRYIISNKHCNKISIFKVHYMITIIKMSENTTVV